MGSIPARYPPPFSIEEALGVPTDSDPIEVGILVVGGGPAGLACAIRLGQLIEEDPATAERPEMPQAALDAVPDAEVVALEAMGARLVSAVGTAAREGKA